jgi:hypothetical protein
MKVQPHQLSSAKCLQLPFALDTMTGLSLENLAGRPHQQHGTPFASFYVGEPLTLEEDEDMEPPPGFPRPAHSVQVSPVRLFHQPKTSPSTPAPGNRTRRARSLPKDFDLWITDALAPSPVLPLAALRTGPSAGFKAARPGIDAPPAFVPPSPALTGSQVARRGASVGEATPLGAILAAPPPLPMSPQVPQQQRRLHLAQLI